MFAVQDCCVCQITLRQPNMAADTLMCAKHVTAGISDTHQGCKDEGSGVR